MGCRDQRAISKTLHIIYKLSRWGFVLRLFRVWRNSLLCVGAHIIAVHSEMPRLYASSHERARDAYVSIELGLLFRSRSGMSCRKCVCSIGSVDHMGGTYIDS